MRAVSILVSVFLVTGMTGCGLLTGGGDASYADRLAYVNKQAGFGMGGPLWWVLRHTGARLVADESPEAALAIRGVHRVQVAHFTLDAVSDARRDEIFDLYANLMRKKKWKLITRAFTDEAASCVYAQYDSDRFRGVFAVAIMGDEMHAVKITGDIRPQAFAELNAGLSRYGVRLPVAQ
jgi:hypothetical protein